MDMHGASSTAIQGDSMSKTYRIACIPGDGIGKEVVPAGQEVLQALADTQPGLGFDFASFGWAATGTARTAR
jgi:isocitrate/isopropylmalate dehydrogenase